MKAIVKIKKEVEIKLVKIEVPVRYEEEQIPNDFPMREGDKWCAIVDVDTGRIADWPQGQTGDLHLKVVDEGTYTLYGADPLHCIAVRQDYVPNGLIPGEYGDYIIMQIDANGIITNWPKKPDVSQFFPED